MRDGNKNNIFSYQSAENAQEDGRSSRSQGHS